MRGILKSYVWNAKIKLDETEKPAMESGWKRILY
jgi:hypothetical protein